MNTRIILVIIVIIVILYAFYIYNKTNNKTIAVISSLPFHIECLGFLLEYIKDYSIHVYINKDKVNYLDYFKTKFNFNIYHINNFNEIKYDRIIKLTSHDPYIVNKKHISILHVSGMDGHDKKNNTTFITLTPFVRPVNINYTYILSIYKDYTDTINLTKNIGFIGHFTKELVNNQSDIIDLINNINGSLICLGYNITDYNNNRIISYENINTISMVNKLRQCSYIIIKEHDDRYSGGITIALSLNIPLIMKEDIAKVYNIPSITYNNNINELTDYINNISFQNYEKIKLDLRNFTDNEIKKNKYLLNNLLV